MQTHSTYINLGVNKENYEIENAEKIHEAFVEKVRDELDSIDMTSKILEGIEDLYSALDYKLMGGSYISKKLLEIAKSNNATIDYYGILADLGTYEYKQIAEILKKDVNNYEGFKTKDNRKNRQEKYYAKHPEKRPKGQEQELENN